MRLQALLNAKMDSLTKDYKATQNSDTLKDLVTTTQLIKKLEGMRKKAQTKQVAQ